MRTLGADMARGLIATTCIFGHYCGDYAMLLRPDPFQPGPYLPVPPPGHPEQFVPGVPPSEQERELWAQFRH